MSESPNPTLERAYRVRLSPTPVQARTLRCLFGARRIVWNWALELDRTLRAAVERSGLTAWSAAFTQLKREPATAWLAELPRQPFDQTLRDLERTKRNFFAGRARPPRRKRFGTVDSPRFTLDQRRQQVTLGERHGEMQIDRLGRVRFRRTETMEGRLRSVTVRCDSAGRWFATFTADGVARPVACPAERTALGIDLGLRQTATCSDGRVFEAATPLQVKLARLRRYQHGQSRQRTQRQIGRLHAQIADARRDHLHQISAAAVQRAKVLILEDLAVALTGRSLHRGFRRGVADAGRGELGRQLTYKAQWHGRVVVRVDRRFPSSKTCNGCGHVHAGLRLRDSLWTCPACGAQHDRDLNAAIDLEHEGRRLLAESLGASNSVPDGGRARSARTDAQGESACATGSTPLVGQPNSTNCELRTELSRLTAASPSRCAGWTSHEGSGGLRLRSKTDDTFPLLQRGEQWTVELIPQTNGNLQERPTSAGEF
jgi:putative transposase